MEQVYFNGEILPLDSVRLDPRDRGFLLGDGVFETMLCREGEIIWLADHLTRLCRSAEVLRLPLPRDFEGLGESLRQYYRDSGRDSGRAEACLRLSLTRGVSESRKLWPVEAATPTVVAWLTGVGSSRLALPIRLVTVKTVRRDRHSPLVRIKSLNYGAAILARIEAEALGGDDGLLLNQDAEVASTTVGNIFLRIEQEWVTPAESAGLLAGLARRRVIDILGCSERVIRVEELELVTQAFVSNSLQLTPVGFLDGRELEPLSLDSLAERLYNYRNN